MIPELIPELIPKLIPKLIEVAIVGGGPGGLMAAHLLERKCGRACRATLFEASARLGGKIHTRRFDAADVMYESGVAESYGYQAAVNDPLRESGPRTGFDDEFHRGRVPTMRRLSGARSTRCRTSSARKRASG